MLHQYFFFTQGNSLSLELHSQHIFSKFGKLKPFGLSTLSSFMELFQSFCQTCNSLAKTIFNAILEFEIQDDIEMFSILFCLTEHSNCMHRISIQL